MSQQASHAAKDDQTLATDLAAADAGALALLYDRHAPAVFAVCVAESADRPAAEEKLVEVFHRYYHDAVPLAACAVDPRSYLLAAARDRLAAPEPPAPIDPPHDAKSLLMTRIAREQDAVMRHRRIPDPHDPYRGLRRAAQVFTVVAAVVFFAVLANVWTKHKVAEAREEERKAYQQLLLEKEAEIRMLRMTQPPG